MSNKFEQEVVGHVKETSASLTAVEMYLHALSTELHRRDPALAQAFLANIEAREIDKPSEMFVEGKRQALAIARR